MARSPIRITRNTAINTIIKRKWIGVKKGLGT